MPSVSPNPAFEEYYEKTADHRKTAPLQLCRKIKYPPVYQIMGSVDSCYSSSHVRNLAAALEEEGVPHVEHIVEGKDHAFDMRAESGDSVHQEVMSPAAKWIISQAKS